MNDPRKPLARAGWFAIVLFLASSIAGVSLPLLADDAKQPELQTEIEGQLLMNRKVLRDMRCDIDQLDQIMDLLEAAEKQSREKLSEAIDAQMKAGRPLDLREAVRESSRDSGRIFQKGVDEVLFKVLTPPQRKRLHEIDLQYRGYEAFAIPAVAKALDFTPEQKKQLDRITQRVNDEIVRVSWVSDGRGGGGGISYGQGGPIGGVGGGRGSQAGAGGGSSGGQGGDGGGKAGQAGQGGAGGRGGQGGAGGQAGQGGAGGSGSGGQGGAGGGGGGGQGGQGGVGGRPGGGQGGAPGGGGAGRPGQGQTFVIDMQLIEKNIENARAEGMKQVLGVLTKEQMASWKKLTGNPVSFSLSHSNPKGSPLGGRPGIGFTGGPGGVPGRGRPGESSPPPAKEPPSPPAKEPPVPPLN